MGYLDNFTDCRQESPGTKFDDLASALSAKGDDVGAEMALHAGLAHAPASMGCYTSLASMMAKRGDLTGAVELLLEGNAQEVADREDTGS